MSKLDTVVNSLKLPAFEKDGTIRVVTAKGSRPLTSQEEVKVANILQEEKRAAYNYGVQEAVQQHLDDLAVSKRYDSMMSVRSYTGFPNEFQRECMSMSIWAGDCWKVVTDLEKQVKAGEIPLPTIKQVLAKLPVYKG